MNTYKTYITVCLGIVFIITILIIMRYDNILFSQLNKAASTDPLNTIHKTQKTPRVTGNGDFRTLPKPWHNDWLTLHEEKGQTFEQFISSNYYRPDSIRNIIYLQPFWIFNENATSFLGLLAGFAQRYFAMPVRLLPAVSPPKSRFAPRQNPFSSLKFQVHTDSILVYLLNLIPEDAFCILGITSIDLYPAPGWNYVFGCASRADRVGVFSLTRLDPAFYGANEKNDNNKLFLLRSCKILSHEAGHLYGMEHCISYHCNMNGSNDIHESDAQPIYLCPVCLRKLQHVLGFNLHERYKKLHTFYLGNGLAEQAQWVTKASIRKK